MYLHMPLRASYGLNSLAKYSNYSLKSCWLLVA